MDSLIETSPPHRRSSAAWEAYAHLPDGVIVFDRNLEIVFRNAASFHIIKQTGDVFEAPNSMDVAEILREDMSVCPDFFDPARQALKTKVPKVNQLLGIRQGRGVGQWLSVSAMPAGSHVVYVFRDVTEQQVVKARLKRTESQLIDHQSFLGTTLDALPCLVSYVDRDYVYRYCNQVYEDWFQVKREDMVNRPAVELIGQSVFDAIKGHLDAAFAGRLSTFEGEFDYKHLGRKNVCISYIPGVGTNGDIFGAYCIVQDVTAQVHGRNLVIQKEQEISKLINNIPGIVGWWSKDLINVHANLAYAEYFGKSPEEVRGMHMRDVIGEDLFNQNLSHIEGVLAGEAQSFERSFKVATGAVKHILANYVPDFVDGEVNGFFAITTDISRIKDAEALQREAEMRLVSNAKMAALGEMAGGIAHEINNPLAIIHGKAGQIQRALKRERADLDAAIEGVAKIEATASRISKIVKGLRSFSRNADLDPMVTVRVSKVIEDTLDLCGEGLKKGGIALRLNVPPDLEIECRPVEISQVLMNLLTNATHAVQELDERWIAVDVHADTNTMKIAVTDSGRGITASIAANIMKPFFTTKDVGRGTGLGLSISKGIAAAHRGSLIFDAESERTRFILCLPRVQAAVQPFAARSSSCPSAE